MHTNEIVKYKIVWSVSRWMKIESNWRQKNIWDVMNQLHSIRCEYIWVFKNNFKLKKKTEKKETECRRQWTVVDFGGNLCLYWCRLNFFLLKKLWKIYSTIRPVHAIDGSNFPLKSRNSCSNFPAEKSNCLLISGRMMIIFGFVCLTIELCEYIVHFDFSMNFQTIFY